MKRFTSILCALCLIVGVLSGVALAPAEEAKATVSTLQNEVPAIITVADFSDRGIASDFDALSEVKVISGSAITISASPAAFSIGGKSQWNHGVVIIEPRNGWSFKGAKFGNNIPTTVDSEIETDSLENVFITLESNVSNESNIPTNVKTLMQTYSTHASSLTGAYINRGIYSQSEYFTFSFAKNDEIQTIKVKVNSDAPSVVKSYDYTARQELDVFGELDAVYPDVLNENYQRSDYEIKMSYGSRTPVNNNAKTSDPTDADYGKYILYSGAGQLRFELKNNKNGITYVLEAECYSTSMPLHKADFIFPSGVEIGSNGGTKDLGDYYITPKTSKAFTEFTVSFTLPNDTSLKSIEFGRKDIPKDNAATIEIDPNSDDPNNNPRNVTAVYSVENSTVTVTVKSVNKKVVLDDAIVIHVEKDSIGYDYSISIGYKRTPEISGMSEQRIPVAAGSTLRLSELIIINGGDDGKKLLYDGITNGNITLSMQGVVPVFENGSFNGLLKVYYPCDRIRVWDNEINATLTACRADIFVNASTLIEAGTVLDIDSLLPGYSKESNWYSKTKWDSALQKDVTYKTTVERVNGHLYSYTLSQDERYFTAPDSVTETVEYVIHAYKADIRVKVCPKGTLSTSLNEVVNDVAADESLVVDAEKAASLSKDAINNFKNNGGKNSSLIFKTGEYEWTFGKNDLTKAAEKNIDLSVKIGDKLVNSRLDKITGVKLGFPANGTLPGLTSFRCYLSDENLTKIKDQNNVSLFYDDGSSTLKREGRNYFVGRDILGRYYIDISITHNSDFILTSTDSETISVSSNSSGGGSSYVDNGSGSSSETTETPKDQDKETKDKAKDKNTTVTENEDGSVTKSTVKENEDGTKTTVDETEFKDGSKAVTETTENADGTESTKTTVTDENGKFYSETVTEESVTKKGTKVEESTTTYADGSTAYTEIRTTKSGKVEETTVKLDKNGKGTASVETTKADGTTESRKFTISTDGVVRIKAVETDGTKATVPESVNVEGKEIPVTIIGKNAFAGTDVEKVTVGSNITTIGVGAFNDAASLKSIVFKAANITKIYKGAFDGIAEDAVIKITASSKKEYNRLVKLIKKSGIAKTVKFKRVK